MKISSIIYLINSAFFFYSFLVLTPNLWTKKLYLNYFKFICIFIGIEILILFLLDEITKKSFSLFVIPFGWFFSALLLDKIFLFLVNNEFILTNIDKDKKELVFNMEFFFSRKFDKLPESIRNTGALFSILLFVFQILTLQILPKP